MMKSRLVRVLSILVLVVFLIGLNISNVMASGPIYPADVNQDNLINQSDIDYLERMLARLEPLDMRGDVNQDGKISLLDCVCIELAIKNLNWGDANQDNITNMADVCKIERILLKLDPITPESDANQDGKISLLDVVWVEIFILNQD